MTELLSSEVTELQNNEISKKNDTSVTVTSEENKMDCTDVDKGSTKNDRDDLHSSSQTMENAERKSGNGEFLSPMSLPPIAKSVKRDETKQKRSPVTVAFRKFAIPADIYKAPKIAAFMTEKIPVKPKKVAEKEELVAVDGSEITIIESEEKHTTVKPKPPPAKLNYESPDWSFEPDDEKYSFEVLKMGSIVDKVDLTGKDHFLVGRLQDCDIKMDHPSISRYHAVLQFGAPADDCANVELQKDGSPGFYVYDLGSTHCTTINKHTISPKTFYRIKVGHVVKFGGSTRLFILQGPSDDQEEETVESATELRAFNREKMKKKKDLERMMLGEDSSSDEEDGEKKKSNQRNTESSGVTWGMLEDAVESSSDEEQESEEEGDTRADHPDAILVHVKKDPFYVKDPVKALKVLYEREKMEPDFECKERRSGHWHVRLCLPVDGAGGKPLYSEVNSTGKKKDAIRQCALEACRVIEHHGLFHHHKVQQRQKIKKWEEDDFYDSDEDEFHDRTGELEHKRILRMKRIKKSSKNAVTVETYETLVQKVTVLDNEVKDIETKLEKDRTATKVSSDSVDPLDAFMQQVKSGKTLDTTTRAKLKRRLFDAKKEQLRLSKLADLARPASLPPLASSTAKSYSFIGKMKGKKKSMPSVRHIPEPEILEEGKQDEDVVEEEENEEGRKTQEPSPKQTRTIKLMDVVKPSTINTVQSQDSITDQDTNIENRNSTSASTMEILKESKQIENNDEISKTITEIEKPEVVTQHGGNATVNKPQRKRLLGPTLPPELKERLLAEQDKPAQSENSEEGTSKPKRKRQRVRKPKQSKKEEYPDDPNYSVWLPPENQTGDGKTSLNEKLGY